jgi:two-component system, NtrC family, sensor kinase
MLRNFNSRVLIVDDEETIRDSFREILCPAKRNEQELNELANAASDLFGDITETQIKNTAHNSLVQFELAEASTGQEAYQMVIAACNEKRPYAAIFIDMRMPGWDGLETVVHIRQIDERAEIIFVTAFSDHSIQSIVSQAGKNINYHCKPFSTEEILQLAIKATFEWNKTSNLEELIGVISQLRAQHWQLSALLENVLCQVATMLGCNSALIALKKGGNYDIITAIGILKDSDIAASRLNSIPLEMAGDSYESGNMLVFSLAEYNIVTLFDKGDTAIQREHIYLVKLFLEQAASAIKNIDLQEALVRQEKLSAVGQGLSMLSHDLRNYIGSVIMGSNMLQEQIADDTEAGKILKLISNSATKGLNMVSDVLDFIRNNPAEKQLISLDAFIADIKNIVASDMSESNVKLDVVTPEGISFVGNASKLERVLVNLIRNACEAMRDSKTQNPHILLQVSEIANRLQFKVTDNGPGIPDKIQDKLFEPFVTADKPGGSGLGLAISKQFVEAHGGELKVVTSTQGTTFTIDIPSQ